MLELSDDLLGGGSVCYRAIHTKTQWRKVSSHRSMENAVLGKDGAIALFNRKARIDYERHGNPTHVLVWQAGAAFGLILAVNDTGTSVSAHKIPISLILDIDASAEGGALPISPVRRAISNFPDGIALALK